MGLKEKEMKRMDKLHSKHRMWRAHFVKGAVGQGVERAERVVQKHGAIAASRGH
jgi:hypothetical protein